MIVEVDAHYSRLSYLHFLISALDESGSSNRSNDTFDTNNPVVIAMVILTAMN